MILVLIIWILIFFVFSVLGFSFVKVVKRFSGAAIGSETVTFDELFFLGFSILSAIIGFLSIFIPIGYTSLIFLGIIVLVLFFVNIREFLVLVKYSVQSAKSLNRFDIFILSFLAFFILTAVVQTITWGDTQSYHAQSIQWTRKFAVVPGLGNLHDGLAFNSMFFVISALFTFQIKDILIFPLNGICYLVLVLKLYSLYKKENEQQSGWKAVFYILTILISLLIIVSNLNSPSADIICSTLIIYIFIQLIDRKERGSQLSFVHMILINFLIFSCISYKLSSLFLAGIVFFFLDKEIVKRSLITVVTGVIVITPFIVRNYYLSGYIIYPFPLIDIFNVDWKIPLGDVIETKSIIEAWAKIPVTPYPEVLKMHFTEWIIPWFKLLSFNSKLLVVINFTSIVTFIIMLLKKDYFLAKIQLIIFLNLAFWFIMAPDPRFGYGFFFVGFALVFSYLLKLFDYSNKSLMHKYINVGLACFLILVVCRRISFPADTIGNPSLWIKPAPFGTVETKDYYTNFHYRVPVPEGGCFNTEIPCTNYPLTNVFKRGEDLQDGFKVIQNIP